MRVWRRENRYYAATVEKDLWGEWVLMLFWGAVDVGGGGRRIIAMPDEAAARNALQEVARRRKQQKYVETLSNFDPAVSH